jgi:hypothetical protein
VKTLSGIYIDVVLYDTGQVAFLCNKSYSNLEPNSHGRCTALQSEMITQS